ncbi:MAG: YebC/PmpR family DNA-binding transcriptional regulator [Deltaproteobacteria bacterium]|nr:YebC/PmpR family DNA-binding transcriptional regulator [Deltaproteobacteria bacterium]MBW2692452.1 YebC/PmpR family DNA-binding transcriptional regulator [Deltaproteobacteria bacterium]
MSGHSKWSTIKRKKGAADAKRGKIFTKLIREIATAARMGGGDPDSNPRLRLACDKGRSANMPKDNIERAIAKGTGAGEGDAYEEVTYEGYGPGGVAVFIETLTDNKNRTVGDVRHILTKHGGNLGASGCVSYLFEKRGVLNFDRSGIDADRLLEVALEAGADDVTEEDSHIGVIVAPTVFESLKRELVAAGFEPEQAGIEMEPTTMVAVEGNEAESMLSLADALDDLDDVQQVYANFDISDEELARIAG